MTAKTMAAPAKELSKKRKIHRSDVISSTVYSDDEISDEESDDEPLPPPPKKARKGKKADEADEDEDVVDLDLDFGFDDAASDNGNDVGGVYYGLDVNKKSFVDDLISQKREQLAKERKGGKEEKKESKKRKKEEEEESEVDWEDEDEEGEGDEDEDEEDEEKGEEEEDEDEDEISEADLDLNDADDEVLAADGFGMGAGSDEEEKEGDEEDNEGDEEEEEEDEDEDEDMASGDDMDDRFGGDMDAEEKARQKDFFAAGEKALAKAASASAGTKKGKKAAAAAAAGHRPTFRAMNVFSPRIMMGIAAAGFEKPTEIQQRTIPWALQNHDIVAQAITGSGKTAAFLLPILERLVHVQRGGSRGGQRTRVVILSPTRELAVQCHGVAAKLGSLTSITMVLAVGGTSFKLSENKLRTRPDIVIATPGRFIDHMRNTPGFAVDGIEVLVLDEADRMLQDGFADELNEILMALPATRQTMLFSATMGAKVDQLVRAGLRQPIRITAEAQQTTAATLTQEFVRLRRGREASHMGYLLELCATRHRGSAIVFFREKKAIHEALVVFGLLGFACKELHGNMKQAERVASLEAFRRGEVRFLLASDLASRGLDIRGIGTVINYDVPNTLDDYIHRIGRTARAGMRGTAVTFVTDDDRKFVKAVRKAMKKKAGEDGVGHVIQLRTVDAAAADRRQAEVDALADDVAEIVREERQLLALAKAEMEATRGENLLKHHDGIMARPKKTWFESAREKETKKQLQIAARRPAAVANKSGSVDKLREQLKHKHVGGWLSRKDMKKLDAKQERLEGKGGRKLKQEKKAGPVKSVRPVKGRPGRSVRSVKGGKKKSRD